MELFDKDQIAWKHKHHKMLYNSWDHTLCIYQTVIGTLED